MSAGKDQAKSIFLNALEVRSSTDRAAFLDAQCGNDVALHQEIEELLRHHDRLDEFLDSPAAAFAPTVAVGAASTGTVIGPYKLLQQIGEGGMGAVYMAEQTHPVQRKVALKLIKPGLDNRQVIARFEAERQALALMEHPNIAKVFDAGTTEAGQPYFVMELVHGVPITKYCDERRLSPRQRLELFVPVCHAIQHAHQKGIIHRDIKPSNVLIAQYDGKPVPKVIDFGVAKATGSKLTDKTMYTEFGSIVGTLEYMSPEQADRNQLDVDTRSDMYSLGVLLYELLTGSTPLDKQHLRGAAILELLRIIKEDDPPKPSTRLSTTDELPSIAANRNIEPKKLSGLVRGELDWIVMKALDKDRERRYETANGFALDIQRYLADEHVLACPPSVGYRLRKLARRNKAALATTGVVALALVAGTAVSTWQAIRATNAEGLAQVRLEAETKARNDADVARNDAEAGRDREKGLRTEAEHQTQRAETALAEVEQQKQRAEANFDKARRAVDEYLTQVTESELLSVPGLQPLREDLLEAALKFYTEFTQERADDQSLLRELAAAQHRLSLIQRELGNTATFKAANAEAVRLFEQLRDQGPAALEVQLGLVRAYYAASRHEDTVKLCQEILQSDPEHAEVRSLLASTYGVLALRESNVKKLDASLKYHQQAFELREALVREYPDKAEYLAELGATVNNLGVLLSEQGKRVEALAMFERGVGYSAQAYELAPHSIQRSGWLCIGLRNVASNQAEFGLQEEALRSYERLVAVSRKRAFENPAITALRGDLSRAYVDLARYQQQLGDTAEANRLFRDAREVLENIPRETADQLFELATVYAALIPPAGASLEPNAADAAEQQRNADLAMQALRKAIAAGYANATVLKTSRLLDPLRDRDDFQEIVATVAKAAEAQQLASRNEGTADQKLADRRQAVTLFNELVAKQPADVRHRSTLAATLQSIGELQTGLKQFADAEKSLNEALTLREQLAQQDAKNLQRRVDVIATQIALGLVDWEIDRRPQAHRAWQQCLTGLHKLAVDEQKNTALQVKIAEQERRVADTYGALAIWELAAAHIRQSAEFQRTTNAVWDARNAVLLPAVEGHDALRAYCKHLEVWFNRSGGPANSPNIALHLVWCAGMVDPTAVPTPQLLSMAQKAYDTEPKNHWHIFCQALAQHRAGQHDAALETLDTHPSNKDWSSLVGNQSKLSHAFLYALAAHGAGHDERARAQLQQAEKLYRGLCEDKLSDGPQRLDPKNWWELAAGQILRREAWQVIDGKLPGDPWHHMIQAKGYRQIGENERANVELAAADAETPNDPDVWMARARLAMQFDNSDRAAEMAWQRVVDLAGNDPLPWIHRGRWYAERGEDAKADADFAKAASLTPNELNRFLEAGWWVMGPYPKELKQFCPPEVDPDPSQPVHTIDPKTGLSEQPVGWRPVAAQPNGLMEHASLTQGGKCSMYALTYVYSPDERSALLRADLGAQMRLWVNGVRVETGSKDEESARIPIVLRQGRNRLLVKGSSNTLLLTVRLDDSPIDRAFTLAEQGRWSEAAELACGPAREELLTNCTKGEFLLPAVACAGDVETYRALTNEFFRRHGNTNDVWTGYCIAVVVSQLPNPAFDAHADAVIARADNFLQAGSGEHWRRVPCALANYRAGRIAVAQQHLDQVAESDWGFQPTLPIRALVAWNRGDETAARQWLKRAEETVDAEITNYVQSLPATERKVSGWWSEFAQFCTLLAEAQQKIRGTAEDIRAKLAAMEESVRRHWDLVDPATASFDHAVFAEVFEPARTLLAHGKRLAELGRFDEAEADFNKAVKLLPDDSDVLAARAVFFADCGEPNKAAADFHAALNLFTDKARPAGIWALPILQQAVRQNEVFERLVALRPADNQRLRMQRTVWCFFSGDLADAQATAKGHVERAAVALLAGDRETCETLRAEAIDSWDPFLAVLHLAQAPTSEPMTTRLLALAEMMWERGEKGPKRRRVLGLAQLRAGKLNEAVGNLEASLTQAEWQEDAMLWPLLAIATSQLGLHDQARTWLARSERWIDLTHGVSDSSRLFGPYDTNGLHFLLAHVFYFEAKALIDGPDAATQARDQLAARDRQRSQATQAKAAARRQNALAKAEADWQRAVELAGDNPLPWIQRGRWYAEHGEHEKADADFAKAASLTPDELNKLLAAGWWVLGTTADPAAIKGPHEANWRHGARGDMGIVDFRELPDAKSLSTAWALNYVYAPEAQSTMLLVGGDNRVRLWLNGRLINEGEKRFWFSYDRVPVLLRPGRNTLLAEVSQPYQSRAFYLRLADGPRDRAIQLMELGQWQESLSLWTPEFQAPFPVEPVVWHNHAALLLACGEVEAYQRVCDQMLQWLGDKPSPDKKLNVAAACSLGLLKGVDGSRLVQLAESGRSGITAKGWPDDYLIRVYHRAGRYADALALSAKAGRTSSNEQLITAMCHYHLGNKEEAGNLLRDVEKWYDQSIEDALSGRELRPRAFSGTSTQVLLREAQELILGKSPTEDPRLAEVRTRVGQILQRSDKVTAAFDLALLDDPRPAQRWLARGQILAECGRPEQAVADLREAVARGFRDLDQLQTDAGWQTLASRDDFRELVREIKAKQAPGFAP